MSLFETTEYRTTAADRGERMWQRAEVETSETTPTPDSTQREVPEEEAGEKESEEMLERKKLERDIEKQQKELKKLEKKKKQEEEMLSKQKAKAFQDVITSYHQAWHKELSLDSPAVFIRRKT